MFSITKRKFCEQMKRKTRRMFIRRVTEVEERIRRTCLKEFNTLLSKEFSAIPSSTSWHVLLRILLCYRPCFSSTSTGCFSIRMYRKWRYSIQGEVNLGIWRNFAWRKLNNLIFFFLILIFIFISLKKITQLN